MVMNGKARQLLILAAAAAMVASMSMAQPALAQTIEKRIDRVEKELKAVQRRVFKDGVPAAVEEASPAVPPQQAVDMERRISALEDQLRQLNGQLEELQHQSEDSRQRLEAFMADAEFRFNQLEGKGAPAGAAAGGAAVGAAGATATSLEPNELPPAAAVGDTSSAAEGTLPAGSPMDQYNYAYALLAQGKYEAAEAAFRSFLGAHGGDELAGNAQYWLGQSLFVRGLYKEAAREFLTGYQSYPKSPKAPAYLLKIGITLGKLNSTQDACDAFKELKSRFPQSPESKERRVQEEKALGCK